MIAYAGTLEPKLFDAFFNQHRQTFLAKEFFLKDFNDFYPGQRAHFKEFIARILSILPEDECSVFAKKVDQFIREMEKETLPRYSFKSDDASDDDDDIPAYNRLTFLNDTQKKAVLELLSGYLPYSRIITP